MYQVGPPRTRRGGLRWRWAAVAVTVLGMIGPNSVICPLPERAGAAVCGNHLPRARSTRDESLALRSDGGPGRPAPCQALPRLPGPHVKAPRRPSAPIAATRPTAKKPVGRARNLPQPDKTGKVPAKAPAPAPAPLTGMQLHTAHGARKYPNGPIATYAPCA